MIKLIELALVAACACFVIQHAQIIQTNPLIKLLKHNITLKYLLECPMCLGFWLGVLFYTAYLLSFYILYLKIILWLVSAGFVCSFVSTVFREWIK